MNKVMLKLTVFFKEPFWIGVYERISDEKLEVCQITFGAEPKDYEIYDFILRNWNRLHYSEPVSTEDSQDHVKINPKRMKREINKALRNKGIGTKAQHALKLQHEQNKLKSKFISRKKEKEEKEKQFELRKQKNKEKHNGK